VSPHSRRLTPRGARRPWRWAWAAGCALLALGALAGFALPLEAIEGADWQPARAWSEPWRWWTPAFVHYSAGHLAANLAGCAVLGAFGHAARLGPHGLAAWAVAWPLLHGALLLQPQLLHYGGLSGLLHAGVAVAAAALVTQEPGRRRWIGAAVLAGLLLKVLLEQPWGEPVRTVAGWDIALAPIAHATGVAAGLACAVVAALAARRDKAR
jgi:rhomboid family GlyGly-CTERM serine protease